MMTSRELHWARSFAARKQRRADQPPRAFPMRYGSYLITLGRPLHPYGRTATGRGYLTHIADEIYLFWRAGRYAGSAVRWRCGCTANEFRLFDEPESTLCVVCPIDRPPRERR
jgi:hypothetical protein